MKYCKLMLKLKQKILQISVIIKTENIVSYCHY